MSNELKNNDGVDQAQVRAPSMANTPNAWWLNLCSHPWLERLLSCHHFDLGSEWQD
jgi:hypothetical protein